MNATTLVGTVIGLADADDKLDDDTKYLILAALEGEEALDDVVGGRGRPAATVASDVIEAEPVGAFLSQIAVSGFRGIGETATLTLQPGPGITVVSGRNGSGKSSFAEAFELAVTGDSYRWRNKAKLWTSSWRNIHHGDPCRIRVDFAVDGAPPATIGVDWATDAGLDDRTVWTQVAGEKRLPGLARLGWGAATELYRPILSYDELAGLFEEGPSKLYDALAKLLGLDEIHDAEKRIAQRAKSMGPARKAANDAVKTLKLRCAESDDERAGVATKLLRSRTPDLDAVERLATGTADGQGRIAQLRIVAGTATPDIGAVSDAAAALSDAVARAADTTCEALMLADRQSALIRAAIGVYELTGDTTCPVCGDGALDGQWKAHAIEESARVEELLRDVRARETAVLSARRELLDAFDAVCANGIPSGIALASAAEYEKLIKQAHELPASDVELADFVEFTALAVAEAVARLRSEAVVDLAAMEAEWAPLAGDLVKWVALEREARGTDATVKSLTAAKKWVTANAAELRNRRLLPLAEQAREIWSHLRQESNVDLQAIKLEGTNTSRRVSLEAAVDGESAGALSVMSQGELHALALALFIPRATAPGSPFRFLVLDDPIQAMDPAKVEGFVRVLERIAATRQIIVFSHDDRLATTIRNLAVDARIVEITRGAGSAINVAESTNPARRYIADAEAVLLDENVPAALKARVVPGVVRLAVEAAARDAYFARCYAAGRAVVDVEKRWEDARTTRQKLALAVEDDREASIDGWLSYRAHRRPVFAVCTRGAHQGAVVDRALLRELRAMVDDLGTLR